MSDYEFTLRFQLQDENDNPENYLDLLFEAGCDDALVGVGSLGSISLNFTRKASTASAAVTSAIQNVLSAIPSAILIELAPDLVNTTDIADIISDRFQKLTRQAVRKYATGQIARAKTRFLPPQYQAPNLYGIWVRFLIGWSLMKRYQSRLSSLR